MQASYFRINSIILITKTVTVIIAILSIIITTPTQKDSHIVAQICIPRFRKGYVPVDAATKDSAHCSLEIHFDRSWTQSLGFKVFKVSN